MWTKSNFCNKYTVCPIVFCSCFQKKGVETLYLDSALYCKSCNKKLFYSKLNLKKEVYPVAILNMFL